MRFVYKDWILECDVEATRHAYAKIPEGGATQCTCSYCRNYCLLRHRVFPETIQQFLEKLGVDWHREAEVAHYNREGTLHLYGGWLHFIGTIELEGTQAQITEHFSISFSEQYAPMFAQFKERPIARIDFFTCLPWVLKGEQEPI